MKCGQIVDYLYGNRAPIEAAMFLLVSAGIKTMPLPGTPFRFYEWLYDFAHQFLNINNSRVVTPPKP